MRDSYQLSKLTGHFTNDWSLHWPVVDYPTLDLRLKRKLTFQAIPGYVTEFAVTQSHIELFQINVALPHQRMSIPNTTKVCIPDLFYRGGRENHIWNSPFHMCPSVMMHLSKDDHMPQQAWLILGRG